MNDVKLFTSGEIHFFNGAIIPVKYALVDGKIVLAHTSDDVYKLSLTAIVEPNLVKVIDPSYLRRRNICYPSYKWDKELNMWVGSDIKFINLLGESEYD